MPALKQSVSIPDDLLADARSLAEGQETTVSALVQSALRALVYPLGSLSFMRIDYEGRNGITIETGGYMLVYSRMTPPLEGLGYARIGSHRTEEFTSNYGYINGIWRPLTTLTEDPATIQ